MAGRIAYYGGIVTNGLILDLDAAKKDSYPGTGTAWNDISGNRNNGTLTNGPTFNSSNGGNIVFDGTDDYVNLPNTSTSLSFGNLNFSVFVWTNVSSFNQYSAFIGKADATATRKEWCLQVSRQVTFQPAFIATDNTSTWAVELNSPSTLNYNQWYNIGVSRVGARFDLYINGISVANTTNNITISSNNLDVEIGRLVSDSTYDFTGRISNILIYKNQGLSSSEILQNYNALKGRYGL
jgi:hypothetical protein